MKYKGSYFNEEEGSKEDMEIILDGGLKLGVRRELCEKVVWDGTMALGERKKERHKFVVFEMKCLRIRTE